ncbi:hypothetical protein NDU88_005233, partial [Pleurodeles waltl]
SPRTCAVPRENGCNATRLRCRIIACGWCSATNPPGARWSKHNVSGCSFC